MLIWLKNSYQNWETLWQHLEQLQALFKSEPTTTVRFLAALLLYQLVEVPLKSSIQ